MADGRPWKVVKDEDYKVCTVFETWLFMKNNVQYTYYPLVDALNKCARQEPPDTKEWGEYPVEILKSTSTFAKAEMYVDRACDTDPNLESDAPGTGRKSRNADSAGSGNESGSESRCAHVKSSHKSKKKGKSFHSAKAINDDSDDDHATGLVNKRKYPTAPVYNKKSGENRTPGSSHKSSHQPRICLDSSDANSDDDNDAPHSKQRKLMSPVTPSNAERSRITDGSASLFSSPSCSMVSGTPLSRRSLNPISSPLSQPLNTPGRKDAFKSPPPVELDFDSINPCSAEKILANQEKLLANDAKIMKALAALSADQNDIGIRDLVPVLLTVPQSLIQFCQELDADDTKKRRLLKCLRVMKGGNENNTVRRMLESIGDNCLWSLYSHKGKSGKKRKFKDCSPLYSIMKAAFLRIYPTKTEGDYEDAVADGLRQAPFREGGTKNRK